MFSIKLDGLNEHLQTHLITQSYVCTLPPGHRLAELHVIYDTYLKGEKVIRPRDFDNFDFTAHGKLNKERD